jgi:hypothetical protein
MCLLSYSFYRRSATGGNIEQNGQTHAHSGGIFRHGCDSVKPGHNGQLMCYMFRPLLIFLSKLLFFGTMIVSVATMVLFFFFNQDDSFFFFV